MKTSFLLTIIIYLLFYLVQGGNQQRSILLEDVKTLTLHKGERTQARRVSPIPQLKCVGGSARCAYEPDIVQCYNRGSDGVDIQWECTSEMPKKYKFGKIVVSCEGYNYPEDPYILTGSCGLKYYLELTDKNFYDSEQSRNIRHSSDSRLWPFLFKVALIVIVFFAVKSCLSSTHQNNTARPTSTGFDHRTSGAGGSRWFSSFFPGGTAGFNNLFGGLSGQGEAQHRRPPPPGFRQDYTNDEADCTTNRHHNRSGASFLSGAALGALGGYVFGTRNRRTNTEYMPGTANTGWFGTGPTIDTSQYRSSSSSSTTHTSTGYGGTTRR